MIKKYLKNLPRGWVMTNKEISKSLHKELLKELPPNHVLCNTPMNVVAHHDGATDNILCNHTNEPKRFTVIHLTWSGKQESNENFPCIEVDGSFEDFLEYSMKSYFK